VGRLILAYQPGAITGDGLRGYAGASGHSTAQLESLRHELLLIRRKGIATGHGKEIEVAAPIFETGPRVAAAIRVAGPAGLLDLGSAIARLRRLAHAASAYLSRAEEAG
jgi:DNA-binding IclR family transcriptional regulator